MIDEKEFIDNLRPNVNTFDKEEALFIYDIKTAKISADGLIQYYLFCIGKQGHTVTLTVNKFPALLEVIIPYVSISEEEIYKLCEDHRIDTHEILKMEFKEKQNFNGFKLNADKTIYKSLVLEMEFHSLWTKNKMAKIIENEFDGIIIGNDTPAELKYFMLSHIKPSSWIKCKRMIPKNNKITTDQLEFTVNYKDIRWEENDVSLPRFVVAGFDIETDNPDGFCKDGSHPVICISTHIYVDGGPSHTFTHYLESPHILDEDTRTTYERQIKAQKSIPETKITSKGTIYTYTSEYQLLLDWKEFITDIVNVDVITGYNIYGFDWLYICERIIKLAKDMKKRLPYKFKFEPQEQYKMKDIRDLTEFFSFGKIKKEFTGLVCKKSVSAAMGTNELFSIPTVGRIHVDMIQKIKNHQTQKIVDTKLDTVSKHFLNESKEDLKAPDLFKIWRLGYKDIIIAYCETDAALPVKLMYSNRLKIILEAIELSKLTITPLNQIINNGKTKYIKNMTIWYATEQNLALNIDDRETKIRESGSYAGAKVLDPVPGKYDNVLVYDFNSLYPSIMQWGNLCPSTMIKNPKDTNLDHIKKFDITDPDTNQVIYSHYFVEKDVYEGLLPKMLNFLVTERKKDQRKMAEVKEEATRNNVDLSTTNYAVLNAAQLAKKLIANSVYGVCAFSQYLYGHKNISETTTAMGRHFIQLAKNFIEKNYAHLNAKCVYGDTDSVFMSIDAKGKNRLEILDIAMEIEKECQKIFPKGIILGFEKIIQNLILSNVKKCYAGLVYEPNPNFQVPSIIPPDQLEAIISRKFFKSNISTGFSTKKKGVPKIVTNLIKEAISRLMNNQTEDSVSEYIQTYINNIDVNFDLDDFIIIKRFKNHYNGAPPYQKVVVDKLRHRKMDTPESGSYIPYVVLTPESSFNLSKLYTKPHYNKYESACGEDPAYLKELGKDKYELNFSKYISMIKSDIDRLFYVFPDQLRNIKLVMQNKNILIKTSKTNTILSMFGKRVEDFLPGKRRQRTEKKRKMSCIESENVRNMFEKNTPCSDKFIEGQKKQKKLVN